MICSSVFWFNRVRLDFIFLSSVWFVLRMKMCPQHIPPYRSATATNQGVTIDTAGSSEDGFTFNDVLGMFVFDIVLYSFLAWYLGNVSHDDPDRDCQRLKTLKLITVVSVPCRAINLRGV